MYGQNMFDHPSKTRMVLPGSAARSPLFLIRFAGSIPVFIPTKNQATCEQIFGGVLAQGTFGQEVGEAPVKQEKFECRGTMAILLLRHGGSCDVVIRG